MNIILFKSAPLVVTTCGALLACCSCASQKMSHGIPHLAEVEPGLWRGGQPNQEGWRYLRSKGVRRDVKLNTIGEASDALATSNDIRVVYLPISFVQET